MKEDGKSFFELLDGLSRTFKKIKVFSESYKLTAKLMLVKGA